MKSCAVLLAGAVALLAGCHPPDRAIYEESRTCVGIFNVASKRVSHADLRKAGLYSDDVQRAAVGDVDAALEFGGNAGIDKATILKELDQARASAARKFADAPQAKLIEAVKQCMPKPEGPND